MAKSTSRLYSSPAQRGKMPAARGALSGSVNDEGGRFVDRNLMSVDPKKEQFEPADSEPVRQRYKMAGGC